jgi:hypothetical protein
VAVVAVAVVADIAAVVAVVVEAADRAVINRCSAQSQQSRLMSIEPA